MATVSQRTAPIELFYSYAHEDEHLRKALEKHLTLLHRQGLLTAWHDRNITAGAEWKGQIDAHLNRASFILLLVSADFIASDYCYDVEMTRALERHAAGTARVIPIMLRPVDHWQSTPFGQLQALPTDAKPVTEWENLDAAFADVAHGIRRAIQATHERADDDGTPPVSSARQVLRSSHAPSSVPTAHQDVPTETQGKTREHPHWWRNATVMAAMIAALAAIVVAVIQGVFSGTPPKEKGSVFQHTEGENSPAVSGTDGDVTITISPEQNRKNK